jgi:hypothetical protein
LPKGSFRAVVKNAIPGEQTTLSVTFGSLEPELIKTDRPLSAQVLWRLTVQEPTYRASSRVEVDSTKDGESIRVGHRTQVYFAYPAMHADWTDSSRLIVTRGETKTPIPTTLRDGGIVFSAEKGTYHIGYR